MADLNYLRGLKLVMEQTVSLGLGTMNINTKYNDSWSRGLVVIVRETDTYIHSHSDEMPNA